MLSPVLEALDIDRMYSDSKCNTCYLSSWHGKTVQTP
jgi:hypothetical protein